jgi:hypothetical protein
MMILIHYADEHPLFTYALYSPRTKRVLFSQDCIFLTSVFPMRTARVAAGMDPEGDILVSFRSPLSVRSGSPPEYSFLDWNPSESLSEFVDDVTGFNLTAPFGDLVDFHEAYPELPVHFPHHPSFGPTSGVTVPVPAISSVTTLTMNPGPAGKFTFGCK